MWTIMDLSKEAFIPIMLVDVVDCIDEKEDHDFLETLLVAHPLLRVGVLIEEVINVPSSQPCQEIQRK